MNNIERLTNANTQDVVLNTFLSLLEEEDIVNVSNTSVSNYLKFKNNERLWKQIASKLFMPKCAPTWRKTVIAMKRLEKGLFVESSIDAGDGVTSFRMSDVNTAQFIYSEPNRNRIKSWTTGSGTMVVSKVSREETLVTFDGNRYLFTEKPDHRQTRIIVSNCSKVVSHDFLVGSDGPFLLKGDYLITKESIYPLSTVRSVTVNPVHNPNCESFSVHGSCIWFYGTNKICLFDTTTGNFKTLNFGAMPAPSFLDMRYAYPGVLVCLTNGHRIGFEVPESVFNPNTPLPPTMTTFNDMFKEKWRHPNNGADQILGAEDGSCIFMIRDRFKGVLKFYNALTGERNGEITGLPIYWGRNETAERNFALTFNSNQSIQTLSGTKLTVRSFAHVESDIVKNMQAGKKIGLITRMRYKMTYSMRSVKNFVAQIPRRTYTVITDSITYIQESAYNARNNIESFLFRYDRYGEKTAFILIFIAVSTVIYILKKKGLLKPFGTS